MPRWASIPEGATPPTKSGVTHPKTEWSNPSLNPAKAQQIRDASTPHGVADFSTNSALLHFSGGVYKTPGVEWRTKPSLLAPTPNTETGAPRKPKSADLKRPKGEGPTRADCPVPGCGPTILCIGSTALKRHESRHEPSLD